jgi:serine protease AprX
VARDQARVTSERASALWGTGSDDGRRRPAKSTIAVALAMLVLAVPLGALAGDRSERRTQASVEATAFVPEGLREAARLHRNETLHVIVVGEPGVDGGEIKNELMKNARGNQFGSVRREFKYVLDGVAADVTGAELLELAGRRGIKSITPDSPVRPLAQAPAELWPQAVGLTALPKERRSSKKPIAIAVVDTGVDKDRKQDFGGRVVQSVELASLPPIRGSATDYSGHGTIVAGIAAGSGTYPGAAPAANIVSLRVMNEEGKAIASDVIAAAEWIFENRESHNIRVVNFSLRSPYPNFSFQDPLNEAVRRLWLTGTVVVAAAGNDGPGRMLYAPASDPFVITVGAVDLAGTASAADDFDAPWSSHGYTAEGFAKPELAAPGRRMVGPISDGSRLAGEFPERSVQRGYMWMSGTSFAAPVVAGAAARIIARHPDWTPDQVKGALMLSARALANARPMAAGVGEIDVAAAAALTRPPNPNLALNRFVERDRRVPGGRVFDEDAWAEASWTDASWDSASWTDASWDSASWSDVSWTDVSWTDASWNSASWTDASWNSASWTDASWNSASWNSASWNSASWNSATSVE